MSYYKHITVDGRTKSLPFTPNGGGNFDKRTGLNRNHHGNKVKNLFQNALDQFKSEFEIEDYIYLEFESAINFELDIAKFQDKENNIRLASCKEVVLSSAEKIYRVAVYLNRKAISNFFNKLQEYINKNSPKGNPRHESLVANIEDIKAATVKSFWQDREELFPHENETVWWELWIERTNNDEVLSDEIIGHLNNNEIQCANRLLVFPEHIVTLIKGTPQQLKVLLFSNQLSELRKPLETSDFFTSLDVEEQQEFIDDLLNRTTKVDSSYISVALLDTGLNNSNPLLNKFIPNSSLDTINPDWGTNDSYSSGHGTPMAGIILYGNLSEAFDETHTIKIFHDLESVKIINRSVANDPDLYGKVTQEAIARAEKINPNNKRIVCLAVTAPENDHKGRPSSWSSSVDQILFGSIEERNDKTLVILSSGNTSLEQRLEYPLSNDDVSINDPAQSFNAITVGAYTLKDHFDRMKYPSAELLAKRGEMAPCNTTAISWDKYWARKPDIVMEGGNDGIFQNGIFDPDSLKLLSTGKGGLGKTSLTTFGDTSGASALASKLIAELYYQYPNLSPETIRGLVIHSANWTSQMLENNELSRMNSEDKIHLLQRVGYGVPNLHKAMNSANNSLTLIAERELSPYKKEKSRIKTHEFHLIELPWPKDILLQLAESQVTLKITLSYFIEPNPGNKLYSTAQNYASHGLRFKMIDRNESEYRFKARISKAIKEEQEDYEAEGSENWILGSKVRDKGSLHKDIWQGNASDLAMRNKIAVFPIGGWWKSRKYKERYLEKVKYSLIVSIETPEEDVDIYTPVLNQLSVDIDIFNNEG